MAATDDGTDLVATRRRKLGELRAAGIDPFPHAFPGVTPIEAVKAPQAGLEAGEETAVAARIAGRLHARRGSGKAAFLDLVDRTGRMQLHARLDVLGEEAFRRLLDTVDLGDIVGADGTVFRTRRGELSLKLESFTVLSKALRPPPDKFHGVSDTELRFRHRELDLMSDEEARALFMTRAKIVSTIRRVLDDDGFVEVETPVLQPIYGGAAARPFTTHFNALDQTMYLRIATELYLKRCIVGGLERVYELGKDFRNEGLSPKHNPEFTMLEWYEAYADYTDVAARYEQLVWAVAQAVGIRSRPPHRLQAAVGAQDVRGRDRGADGGRDLRAPLAGRAAGGDARAGPRGPRARGDLGAPGRPPPVEVRRAAARRSRPSCSTTPSSCRPSPSATAPGPAWSSASRRSQAAWRSPTRSPSSTTRTTSAPASRSRGSPPGWATTRPSRWTRPSCRRSSTGCRPPAGWARGSTG